MKVHDTTFSPEKVKINKKNKILPTPTSGLAISPVCANMIETRE